jgi:transposase
LEGFTIDNEMSGVVKINITESGETLKTLLAQQKTARGKERVQALYLLKTGGAETVEHIAVLLGRHRVTVQGWLRQYRQGGLSELLKENKRPGRTPSIPSWAVEKLREELKDPEGFESYGEVQKWLKAVLGVSASYKVVHAIVRYQLKAKLKVPRPKSEKQPKGAIETFKKKLSEQLRTIVKKILEQGRTFRWLRYWCQDETLLGMKTIQRRVITLQGVKPQGLVQWERQKIYLYGLVEPISGESFFYEFCHLDTVCFEKFLELFSEEFAKDIHIIQLDNASFHEALYLSIPDNIILLFQPPHCPEVNPIERFWEELKEEMSWNLFNNLEQLRAKVKKILNNLSKKVIASVTGWDFILEALFVAGL